MSRKDYQLIAEVLRAQKASASIIEAFCFAIGQANKAFDANKFRKACQQ